jgi:hypothetical protein
MARMAEGFDKTMDEAQEDLDAASEEFAQEATKNATEGIKHKQRLLLLLPWSTEIERKTEQKQVRRYLYNNKLLL